MCQEWTHLYQLSQIEARRTSEQGGADRQWYCSTINMQNLPRLYKIRKDPILDPGATMHQQAGTGIWLCDTKKKPPKKQNKKVARDYSNLNWQGIRRNDVEAVNQEFGANNMEIKHKCLEAIRLLRQADCVLEEICKYVNHHMHKTAICKWGSPYAHF